MKLLSWNLNGLKSAIQKGLMDIILSGKFDIMAFQEIRSDGKGLPLEFSTSGYRIITNPAKKAGYSGTMTLSREEPLSVSTEMSMDEGRVLTTEFENFYLLNCYFPNSRRDLSRLQMKLDFDRRFAEYAKRLEGRKPVIICGDLNVAHTEMDIARPDDNHKSAGFTDEERAWMTEFLNAGYVDTFRMFHKEGGQYSWWSYMHNARAKNIGWRIDYFIVSKSIEKRVKDSGILSDVTGSDHAPIYLDVEF
ncbi:exodeoxyribonuclease III [Cuniculiplasma sp. SKW4]|uniref:exodeoxyribonuclease III n=1 Tax=Cuniculiplasma sp. SKW4 TaxID=3400171 RepID=UPI003FD13CAF